MKRTKENRQCVSGLDVGCARSISGYAIYYISGYVFSASSRLSFSRSYSSNTSRSYNGKD